MLNTRGNSIIEVMVVIVILTTGIVGTYNILNGGQKLATASENRIKAINIAREGLEIMENIRDTNWIKFSSDYPNCWLTKNYNATCIGNTNSPPSTNIAAGSYTLSQSGSLWYLSNLVVPSTNVTTYRTQFPIYVDSNGLTTSSGSTAVRCDSTHTTNCLTRFTREIKLSFPDLDHMKIDSIVTWTDNTKTTEPFTLTLSNTLTNWKKNF